MPFAKHTDAQKKVIQTIEEYIHEYHYPPTLSELAERLRISREWCAGTLAELEALVRKNVLTIYCISVSKS